MKTWRGVALDNFYVGEFEDGRKFSLQRGRDYCLAGIDSSKDGKVFLMSQCWKWVPKEWFGSIKPEDGSARQTEPTVTGD